MTGASLWAGCPVPPDEYAAASGTFPVDEPAGAMHLSPRASGSLISGGTPAMAAVVERLSPIDDVIVESVETFGPAIMNVFQPGYYNFAGQEVYPLIESRLGATRAAELLPGEAQSSDPWVFGGRINQPSYINAQSTFQSVSMQGTAVVFVAALVRQSVWDEGAGAEANAQRIGVFRSYGILPVGGGDPGLEPLAIDGELVSPYLSNPTFLAWPDARWRLAGPSDTVPIVADDGALGSASNGSAFSLRFAGSRFEERVAKAAALSLNIQGRAAFLGFIETDDVLPLTTVHGAIFVETSPSLLHLVAVERTEEAQYRIATGLGGVGTVNPWRLGRPVMNDAGRVAFYAETDPTIGTLGPAPLPPTQGLFVWDGATTGIQTVTHENAAVPGHPGLVWDRTFLEGSSMGIEQFPRGYIDQPDINICGELAFRASIRFSTPALWKVSADLSTYTELARQFDTLPGGIVITGDGVTAFSRPSINSRGDVACVVTGFDPNADPSTAERAALVHFDPNGAPTVLAAGVFTGLPVSTFYDENGDELGLCTFGGFTGIPDYHRDLSITDRGQIIVRALYGEVDNALTLGEALLYADLRDFAGSGGKMRLLARTGGAVGFRPDFMLPDYILPANGAILSGAGSLQDGDSPVWDNGRVVWASVGLNDAAERILLSETVNPCPVDFVLRDGIVNTAEFGILTGAFGQFADCLNAPYSSACLADVNCDGIVNTPDLGLVIGAFQRIPACPVESCSGASSLAQDGGDARGLLLSALGFESIDVYLAWISTLDRDTREGEFEILLEIARAVEASDAK